MVRIQLHLNEAQDKALRAAARRRGETRAELIRRAIDVYLAQSGSEAEPLLDLIGAAGPHLRDDISEQHDAILYGAGPGSRLPLAAETDEGE
jgi:hypothetical protein